MRIKSLVEPKTEKLSVGDEWISPDGYTPKFRKIWNGTGWDVDLAESGFPLAKTGKAILQLQEVEEDLEDDEEKELEEKDTEEESDEDSDEDSEDSGSDSTKTEDLKSEQSVPTTLPAGNGRAEKSGEKSQQGKKSDVRKRGKGK